MVRIKIFKYEDYNYIEDHINDFLSKHRLTINDIKITLSDKNIILIYEKQRRYVKAPFHDHTPGDVIEE